MLQLTLLGAAIVVALGTACLLLLLRIQLKEFRNGTQAALQHIQYQIAYLGGALRIPPRELAQAAAPPASGSSLEEPVPPTEVVNADPWTDLEEMAEYAPDESPGRFHE